MEQKQTHCQHGKPLFATPPVECIDCEIVWYQDCLNDAAKRVMSCNEQIARLLAKRIKP